MTDQSRPAAAPCEAIVGWRRCLRNTTHLSHLCWQHRSPMTEPRHAPAEHPVASADRECLCEGEFTWACGPECECFHHSDEPAIRPTPSDPEGTADVADNRVRRLECGCMADDNQTLITCAIHEAGPAPADLNAGHAPMPPEGGDLRITYRASEVIALGNRRYDEGYAAGRVAAPADRSAEDALTVALRQRVLQLRDACNRHMAGQQTDAIWHAEARALIRDAALSPSAGRNVLREALNWLIDHSTPQHSIACASQDDDVECFCGVSAEYERILALSDDKVG